MSIERIGAIGDVHTEDQFLAAAVCFLHAANCDALLCTGDIATGTGDINRCCQLLQEAGVATVRGNHDRWFLHNKMGDLPNATPQEDVSEESRAFISSLPVNRSYETSMGRLLLCHGLGDDDMVGVFPHDYGYALEVNYKLHGLCGAGEYRFVINGHTHHRMVRSFDHLTIINAGTLRRPHQPGFLIADFQAGFVQFYDIHANLEIKKSELCKLTAIS